MDSMEAVVRDIKEALESWDNDYAEGMSHEEMADYARDRFIGLLYRAVAVIEREVKQ